MCNLLEERCIRIISIEDNRSRGSVGITLIRGIIPAMDPNQRIGYSAGQQLVMSGAQQMTNYIYIYVLGNKDALICTRRSLILRRVVNLLVIELY